MALTLKLEIVTPDAIAYPAGAQTVTLPAIEGQIGVYPQHIPLMTQIVPGEIIVQKDGQESFLAVGEGVVEVPANRAATVTDMAIPADHIDEAKVEEARQRAAARLQDKISDEEVATINASLARSLAQLKVKRRHPGSSCLFPRAPGSRATTGRGCAGMSWPASRWRPTCCPRQSAT